MAEALLRPKPSRPATGHTTWPTRKATAPVILLVVIKAAQVIRKCKQRVACKHFGLHILHVTGCYTARNTYILV